jgi:hypothetical protein
MNNEYLSNLNNLANYYVTYFPTYNDINNTSNIIGYAPHNFTIFTPTQPQLLYNLIVPINTINLNTNTTDSIDDEMPPLVEISNTNNGMHGYNGNVTTSANPNTESLENIIASTNPNIGNSGTFGYYGTSAHPSFGNSGTHGYYGTSAYPSVGNSGTFGYSGTSAHPSFGNSGTFGYSGTSAHPNVGNSGSHGYTGTNYNELISPEKMKISIKNDQIFFESSSHDNKRVYIFSYKGVTKRVVLKINPDNNESYANSKFMDLIEILKNIVEIDDDINIVSIIIHIMNNDPYIRRKINKKINITI